MLVRLRARRALVQFKREGTVELTRRELNNVLRDRDMFSAFAEELNYMAEITNAPFLKEEDVYYTESALTDFLEWLIENKEDIIELIKLIISLFSGA